jgi:hypothetical protein
VALSLFLCPGLRSRKRSPRRELQPKRILLSSLEFPFLHAQRCTCASLHSWSHRSHERFTASGDSRRFESRTPDTARIGRKHFHRSLHSSLSRSAHAWAGLFVAVDRVLQDTVRKLFGKLAVKRGRKHGRTTRRSEFATELSFRLELQFQCAIKIL